MLAVLFDCVLKFLLVSFAIVCAFYGFLFGVLGFTVNCNVCGCFFGGSEFLEFFVRVLQLYMPAVFCLIAF